MATNLFGGGPGPRISCERSAIQLFSKTKLDHIDVLAVFEIFVCKNTLQMMGFR